MIWQAWRLLDPIQMEVGSNPQPPLHALSPDLSVMTCRWAEGAPLAVPGACSAAALVAELLLAGAPVVLQGAGRVGHALLFYVRHVARDLRQAQIDQAGAVSLP